MTVPERVAAATKDPVYQARPWPVLRNALVSYMNTHRHNGVQGFIEIDVTDALRRISEAQKTLRIAVSFHAYMLHAMVRALVLHPTMVSYRHKNQLVSFEDIDVLTPVEKRITDGGRIPVGYVVRGAQAKSLAQINRELREATAADDITTEAAVKMRRRFARWPRLLRDLVSRHAQRNPFFFKRLHGTVILTNVRPPGFANAGTVLGPTVHTLSLALGTITDRVRLDANGAVTNRKILVLGAAGDHDIIDGMIAARFIADMTRIAESAAALDDAFLAECRQLAAGDGR
ncbi:MAG TPA: 2-oxo acid dehydrogenase subunit E2 [Ramlibacter sp.]|jgi:pyruvate/2-oxoglutarate dehydrogenase complex dihydrolipoamide acyltransferase (E2) component